MSDIRTSDDHQQNFQVLLMGTLGSLGSMIVIDLTPSMTGQELSHAVERLTDIPAHCLRFVYA
eukprot:8695101-Karenia_brevis.AAC.1